MSPSTAPAPSASVVTGFDRVDQMDDGRVAVDGMAQTAELAAVRRLRQWETRQLGLRPGDRLLDVGCGAGERTWELAAALAPGGEAIGLDISQVMLEAARSSLPHGSADRGVAVSFRLGDVLELGSPLGRFDAVRAERALQWLDDPSAGLAEMVRVTRPGGIVSVLDTDWTTLSIDLPDPADFEPVTRALRTSRPAGYAVGRTLLNRFRQVGLSDIRRRSDVQTWTEWDALAVPGPPGFLPLQTVVPELAAAGAVSASEGERAVSAMVAAARDDRLFISVTMIGVTGRV